MQTHLSNADIVVCAIGKPNIIKTSWLKSESILIDVGIKRLANNKIIGDIDFNTACEKASWITPVPGGVGPMTVISLLENTMLAATKYLKKYNQDLPRF